MPPRCSTAKSLDAHEAADGLRGAGATVPIRGLREELKQVPGTSGGTRTVDFAVGWQVRAPGESPPPQGVLTEVGEEAGRGPGAAPGSAAAAT